MNVKELKILNLELLKIEVNCLKLMSEKLSRNDYHSDIENISKRAIELKLVIDELIIKEQ